MMFASTAGGGAMGTVFREKPKAKQQKKDGTKTVRLAGANRSGKASRRSAA